MIKKKILVALFTINLTFLGLSNNGLFQNTNVVYAENDQEIKFSQQEEQLRIAVNDSVNVTSSEVYNTLTDQTLKANYLDAVNYGKSILSNVNNYSFNDLRDATLRINDAKYSLSSGYKLEAQLYELEQAIEINQYNADAARLLLENYPNTVKNIRQELLELLDTSNKLIANAKAILAQYR